MDYFQIPSLESLNLAATLPAVSVAAWATLLLLIDLFIPQNRKHLIAWLAAGNLVFAFVANLLTFNADADAFSGMYRADAFTGLLNVIILISAFVSILMSTGYLRRTQTDKSEFYPLLLFTTSGMMFMVAANDLITIFVALELLSIPLYVLSAFRAPEQKSEEAGFKYFLLGAFASAFLVFGSALVYGATGETRLPEIFAQVDAVLASQSSAVLYLLLGAGLIIVGLGFKVAVVPFHTWTPDVYQGAPTPVTAFMSIGAKAGGFGALLRVLIVGMSGFILVDAAAAAAWQQVIAIIATLTVILGNVVAIAQSDIKRMLAYSSVAHAGYVLMAVAAAGTQGIENASAQAALIYLLAYTFTNLGAFGVAMMVERSDGTGTRLEDFVGLGRSRPLAAFMMAVFMLSLTGIPLTAGFVGKALVFNVGLQAGLYAMVIFGVLTSVVSAFYYVRVIVNMYLRDRAVDADTMVASEPTGLMYAIYASFAGTLLLGIVPWLITALSDRVVLLAVAP
jgi:NADH-quinone oxidoreductase subunit N